jgi:hypothetical protein
MEKWEDIKGYEGIYQISNNGCVRRWRKKAKNWFYLKPITHSGGYKRLKLRNKGNDKDVYIHRLVAEAFIANKKDQIVNHKDSDKTNNVVSNLEWVNQRENVSHGQKVNNLVGVRKKNGKWSCRIFLDNKRHYLGSFKCETSAYFAYLKALKDNNLINKYA